MQFNGEIIAPIHFAKANTEHDKGGQGNFII